MADLRAPEVYIFLAFGALACIIVGSLLNELVRWLRGVWHRWKSHF